MNFKRLAIKEVILCKPTLFEDDRRYFAETFRQDKLDEFLGFKLDFCQDNESKSSLGVLRGLHYQLPPFAQTKLVREIKGSVLDVAVDIRQGSPTFGQYVGVELTEENKKQLLVPKGVTNGFVVLSEDAIFAYKVDNYYCQESDRGISFNGPMLYIDWKLNENELQLSSKDTNQPLFEDAEYFEYEVDLYK